MTFNFRCYGKSDCQASDDLGYVLLNRDIDAAIDYVETQGFKSIVCIRASMSGRAFTEAAFEQELAGFVIVSGSGSENPAQQDPNDFISLEKPKLFMVTENDPGGNGAMVENFMNLYEEAPEPKTLKSFPGAIHGTEFLDTRKKAEFSETLPDFIDEIITGQ
ncbi:MAG: dienelactone hydrolase family protein [Anaerolineales bacterium]|nr:dienelactone hydrolase family protein [Anaerolineales bacterium]